MISQLPEKSVPDWLGHGIVTYPDGSKYVGECKDDKPWNGTGYDKNGKINVIFANGVQK